MTVAYCDLQDVYDLGLTARAFVVRPFSLNAASGDYLDFATGTFSLLGHGFAGGASPDLIRFVLKASGGSIPTGASTLSVYYPLPIDGWRFQLATSPGGTPVTFSDAGTSSGTTTAWGLQLDHERRLSRIILATSGDIDQDLVAHGTPIQPDPTTGLFPQKLVNVVARESARAALFGVQFENAEMRATAVERLKASEEDDKAQRDRWRKGEPLLPIPLDATPTVADNAPRAKGRHPMGWGARRVL